MIEAITGPDDVLGEGAVWDDRAGHLWWVDILRRMVRRLDPTSGATRSWELDDAVGALAMRADGDVLVAVGRSLGLLDPDSGAHHRRLAEVDPDEGNRMNDGRVDPAGRFWVGTMDRQESRSSGALYRLDPDWTVHRLLTGLDIPNSLSFSPDGGTMYFTETRDQTIQALTVADDGSIAGSRVFARPEGPGNPDGSCVDAEGCLWNAEWGGARVVRYRPDGRVDRVVEVPAPHVTCPTIGGTILYVTTARKDMAPEDLEAFPASGSVFAVDVGVQGLPTWRFGG